MSRLSTTILLLLAVVFAAFAFYNTGTVTVTVWKGLALELPVVGLVLSSMALGAAVVLVIFALRGMRNGYRQYQDNRRRKRRRRLEELYHRGVEAHLSGKVEHAVTLLKEAAEGDSTFLLPVYRLGQLYLENDRAEEAVTLLTRAMADHPRNLRVLFTLVDSYLLTDQLAQASSLLRRILEFDDGNLSALELLRDIQEEEGDWPGAEENQKRLLRLRQGSAEEAARLTGIRYQLALQLGERGQHDRAEKILREMVKKEGDFVPARVALAETRMAQGALEEGLGQLVRGYRSSRHPVFLQTMEDSLLAREEPRRLYQAYQELLGDLKGDALLNLFYGKVCLRLEMIDAGYQALKRVESLGYEAPILHALLGEFDIRRERQAEAIEEYRKALEGTGMLMPDYECVSCGAQQSEWSGRCLSCGLWGTFVLPQGGEAREVPATAPRYGEE